MVGTNRTVRLLRGLALAILVAALLPAAASALGRAPRIKGAHVLRLEHGVKSTSVAIAPDGTPWFGLEIRNGEGTRHAHVSAGKLSLVPVSVPVGEARPYSSTSSLRFDAGATSGSSATPKAAERSCGAHRTAR